MNDTTAPDRAPDRRDSAALGINLRHLHAFSAVAAAGSIARAADGLLRVPSAVTRSVLQLEAALGQPLFARGARGVSLNACGERVQVRAQRIAHEFDEARMQLVARGGVDSTVDPQSLFTAILNGRRLAVIASLSEQRNMPSVARDFGITQPAISVALKDLERGLGVALFERRASGLLPTVAGGIVALYFKRVLSELRHMVADIAAVQGTWQGRVQVGVPPSGCTHILPMAIVSLLARHPRLQVGTVERSCDALLAALRSGDIDFVLGGLRREEDTVHLEQQVLFDDCLSIIGRAGHPLTRAPAIDVHVLRGATWALPHRGAPAREMLDDFFAKAGEVPPTPAVETGDLAVLRGVLRESDMLTAISGHPLCDDIRDGRLVVLDVPLEQTTHRIGLTQRLGALPSPGARALMEAIKDAVAHSAEVAPTSRARR